MTHSALRVRYCFLWHIPESADTGENHNPVAIVTSPFQKSFFVYVSGNIAVEVLLKGPLENFKANRKIDTSVIQALQYGQLVEMMIVTVMGFADVDDPVLINVINQFGERVVSYVHSFFCRHRRKFFRLTGGDIQRRASGYARASNENAQ